MAVEYRMENPQSISAILFDLDNTLIDTRGADRKAVEKEMMAASGGGGGTGCNRAEMCISALRSAQSDTEKFAALLLITKVVKAQDCDRQSRRQIFDAIGFEFVNRLLNTTEVPDECPPYIYQAIALTLLACFCTEPDLSRNAEMLKIASQLADFVVDSGSSLDEEMMVTDALLCITSIASRDDGKAALIDQRILGKLCKVVVNQTFGYEQALAVIFSTIVTNEVACWAKDPAAFQDLIGKIAVDFLTEHGERKFELCQKLVILMRTFPKELVAESYETAAWHNDIHRGLQDILFSKVAVPQMDPALRLTSVMLEKLGLRWAIGGDPDKGKQFFLIFIHLSCIEVRMIMEDRSFDQVVEESALLIACFSALETVISLLVTNNSLMLELEHQQKQQLYAAVTGAMNGVISFLSGVAKSLTVPMGELDASKKQLLFATFRVTGSWLAEETSALRDEVCEVLPLLLKAASHTCERLIAGHHDEVDILRFLLPGLCHLSAEDQTRAVVLGQNFHIVLLNYLNYKWKLFLKDVTNSEVESTLVTICGVFMNIVVMESTLVLKDKTFHELMHFVFRSLPELEHGRKHLVLIGHLSVLGLLLLRHYAAKIKSCETAIYRYLSSSIKFLWDAHNIEDSRDMNTMVIARDYKKVWDQVMELWFLGMQALSTVLPKMSWIAQFIIESGWTTVIVETLLKIPAGAVDASTKSAYEHVLCCLVQCGLNVGDKLKSQGALQVCTLHNMKELKALLLA